MLHPVLAEVCDKLARSTVMRAMDEQELCAFGDDAHHAIARREQWRTVTEEAVLQALRRFIAEDRRLEKEVVETFKQTACIRDAEDEAVAMAYALTRGSFESNPFRHTIDVACLFNVSNEAGRIFSVLETKKKPSTVVEQMMTDLLDQNESGVRPLLLEATRTWRVLFLLFQRYISISGLDGRRSCNITRAIEAHLEKRRAQFRDQLTKVRPPSTASADLRSQALVLQRAASSLDGKASTALSLSNGRPASDAHRQPRKQHAWDASAEQRAIWSQKWIRHIRIVARLQACVKRRAACRRHEKLLVKEQVRRRAVTHQKRSNLTQSLAKTYSEQLPDALKLYETLSYLQREDERLETFYSTEEDAFNRQWNEYVKKMTNFFLKECPLDVDWVRQINPQNQKHFYLNIKTGKIQEENPNALKVVAGKNRQWVKATRARDDRLLEARRRVDELNELRREVLPALERRLSAPIFL